MANATEMETELIAAVFEQVRSRDRNAWYAVVAVEELTQIEGPLRRQLVDAVDEEINLDWLEVRRALADAVTGGGLRPTHLHGVKPV